MDNNIWEIEKLMGLKKFDSPYHTGGFIYQGTMSTGNFNGVWQGFSVKEFTGEELENLAQDIISTYRIKLPSEEEFNNFLNKYKIHGVNTG